MPQVSCLNCSKIVEKRASDILKSKRSFCSRECSNIGRRVGEFRECFICKKSTFFIKCRLNQPRHFCSMNCYKQTLRGRKVKESTKNMLRAIRKGDKNPNWKGDTVGYKSLHDWVRGNIKHSDTCMDCGQKKKFLDLANISQEYKRDLSDWEWLCRRCHMVKDGRLERFLKLAKKNVILKPGGNDDRLTR